MTRSQLYKIIPLIVALLIVVGFFISPQLASTTEAQSDNNCAESTHVAESRISLGECEALLTLYNTTGGGEAWHRANWGLINQPPDFLGAPNVDVCDWSGVDCGATGVEALRLPDAKIMGSLPSEISGLTNLLEIDLSGGGQLISLPPEIGNLTNLIEINFSENQLSSIPTEFGLLAATTKVDLSENQLSTLPAEIGNLTNLIYLKLSSNQLSSLPDEIGNLSNLSTLIIVGNRVRWSLPTTIGNLNSLTGLYIRSSNLHGTIPAEIGNFSNLVELFLSRNSLTGEIPAELGNLQNLEYLTLHTNLLTGEIPSTLGNLSNLEELSLYNNQLSGEIPATIGDLDALKELDLCDNQLSGDVPPELGKLADQYGIDNMNLCNNLLSGEIPSELANNGSFGYRLDLSGNPLTGPIPMELLNAPVTLKLNNTDVCAPDEDSYYDVSNDNYFGGLICGEPGSTIRGTVTDLAGNLLPNIQVDLFALDPRNANRPPIFELGIYEDHAWTNEDGEYEFTDLGITSYGYIVRFIDPTGRYTDEYNNNVFLSKPFYTDAFMDLYRSAYYPYDGETIVVDAVLGDVEAPPPPPVDLAINSGVIMTNSDNGTFVVNMPKTDMTNIGIAHELNPECDISTHPEGWPLVSLVYGRGGDSYSLTDTVGSGIYTLDFPAQSILDEGGEQLILETPCRNYPVGSFNAFDPIGAVTDADSGTTIDGAEVRLYRVRDWKLKTDATDMRPNTCESVLSKPDKEPWSQPAPTDQGVLADPALTDEVSPAQFMQITDSDGLFGWDLPSGCWYVTVEAEGYVALTSPVVGIGEASLIEGLDLALQPLLDPTPTAVPTDAPTSTPTAMPTAVPTDASTSTPTTMPTDIPTVVPTSTPTAMPTAVPTDIPTVVPTSTPTTMPTTVPTAVPPSTPTATATAVPTDIPTVVPTSTPTTMPTDIPTVVLSSTPTAMPTAVPTDIPTVVPTSTPTTMPTDIPTVVPSSTPTAMPTAVPTDAPTSTPTSTPTTMPTDIPTVEPTSTPTTLPTTVPVSLPTPLPTDEVDPVSLGDDAVEQVSEHVNLLPFIIGQ